jgi:hypothetical protein
MKRSATEVIRNLEMRVARLEKVSDDEMSRRELSQLSDSLFEQYDEYVEWNDFQEIKSGFHHTRRAGYTLLRVTNEEMWVVAGHHSGGTEIDAERIFTNRRKAEKYWNELWEKIGGKDHSMYRAMKVSL